MPERIKFYLDEHVPRVVVLELRKQGVDALTVAEAGMRGAADEQHLAWALAESRVIFTHDKDFLRLNAAGIEHAGIVYATRRLSIGEVVQGLMLVYQVLDPEAMRGHVEYL